MPRKIDLRFPVFGTEIPADHGFRLFSAISGIVPEIHDDEGIGIHSINGTLSGNRCLTLTRRSFLAIRLEVERVRHLMRLAGKVLQIGRARVGVGVPQAWALAPAERLYSRLVVIKGFMKPDTFLEAARTQLAELGVEGEVSLVAQPDAQAVN
ncbi:MAG: type I-MYXAN CRISPR-associated protein Cas6/Cmx6, partial [Deltaproteobacteria bacterium]